MTTHVNWTEIDNFHTLRKTLNHYPELLLGQRGITYKAKVKLHGTNAGVRIDPDGTVTALSRSNVITPNNDNAGFAKWVHDRKEAFARFSGVRPYVVYGEWCGPGIQKGVAVANIPEKIFAVFAARVGNEFECIITEPFVLAGYVHGVEGAYVIPWFNDNEQFTIDWAASPDTLQPVLDTINSRVADVEACDPWVSELFHVDGTGEGLVFYPFTGTIDYKNVTDLMFKAKGDKHQVVAKTKAVQADATVVAGAQAFAELVITDARCEQGMQLAGGPEMRNMGAFLKWIGVDVAKETKAELEASGADPKLAAKACSDRARNWFITQVKKL